MRSAVRLLAAALVPLLALVAAQQPGPPEVVRLAACERPAVLAFEVRARGGGTMPARLTFVPAEGTADGLFAHTDAAPDELAVRDGLVYTRTGAGRITVPPGRYTVVASHGLEWSLARRELEFRADEEQRVTFVLEHELDTRGWVSGDFHLHTLTYSGHGDANVEERLLACLGEGLEFAVATDHDHLTDYGPKLRELGIARALASAVGDEVTTPIGHFNAFPLDPARAPVDSSLTDANALFRLLRAEPSPGGRGGPLIELNHPRLAGIDCFTHLGLDPVTGTSADPAWSRDFDAIEVLSDNRALGYRDPVADHCETPGHAHSALADWFHLLDQGERYAAVGNSDSHHVHQIVAGYPRNFVRSASDDPADVRAGAIADAVRAKQVFTTTGPFLEYTVEGVAMGGSARAVDGHARLHVGVHAASWVDCDRVKVFVDGALVATLPIPDVRTPARLDAELELCLLGACERHGRKGSEPGPHDSWVVVAVEGDDALTPVLGPDARPLALGNPVWIDGDGDGEWTAPRARIAARLRAQATPALASTWFAGLRPEEQTHALALVPRGTFAAALLDGALASPSRDVRLAAARACERVAVAGSLPGVQRAWAGNSDDPYLGVLLVRALAVAQPERGGAILSAYTERFGEKALGTYADELAPALAGTEPRTWALLGPLPAASPWRERATPPPADAELDAGERTLAWRAHERGSANGYLDLARLDGQDTAKSLVYAQVYLRVDAARAVTCAFGSDDGGRVWLGEHLVYENRAQKRANPLEKLLALELQPGWNRVVIEVENGEGAFGFYFRVLDPHVEAAPTAR